GFASPTTELSSSFLFFSVSFAFDVVFICSFSFSPPLFPPLSASLALGKGSLPFGLSSGSRDGRESRRLSGLRSRRPLPSLPLSFRERSSRTRSLPELSPVSLRSLRLLFRLSSGRLSSERRLSDLLPNLPDSGDFESDFSLEDNDACFKTKTANLWCNENIRQLFLLWRMAATFTTRIFAGRQIRRFLRRLMTKAFHEDFSSSSSTPVMEYSFLLHWMKLVQLGKEHIPQQQDILHL
ncbi:hypothetical protein pdam_00000948, partial [Pocillopora damicornis]